MTLWKHLLLGCLMMAWGLGVGRQIRPGNSEPTDSHRDQRIKSPSQTQQTAVLAASKTGPPLEAAKTAPETPPPLGLSLDDLQEWMRQRWQEGRHDLVMPAFLAISKLEDRQKLAKAFATTVAHLDPRLVAQLVLSLPAGRDSDLILNLLLCEWARVDAHEAFQFLTQIAPARLNQETVSWFWEGFSALPPARIMAFAEKLTADQRRNFLAPILQSAAQGGSWQNTEAWLAVLPAADRSAIIRESNLPTILAQSSPEALAKWRETESDSQIQDILDSGLAEVLARSDPASGLSVLEGMASVQERSDSANRIVGSWLFMERRAALDWMRSPFAASVMKPKERTLIFNFYGLEAEP